MCQDIDTGRDAYSLPNTAEINLAWRGDGLFIYLFCCVWMYIYL